MGTLDSCHSRINMSSLNSTIKLNNGQEIPVLGLGTWLSEPGEVKLAVEHALKIGYRHVDCAAIYFNEKEVGDGIKASGVPREEIFVTGKLWCNKHHPDDVEEACRKSLSDLSLDYLDEYLMHFPSAFKRGDEMVPKDENGDVIHDDTFHFTSTWLAMEKLVEKGLVRTIGTSNFNSQQIQELIDAGTIKPAMNQVEIHPFFIQTKLIDFCRERGVEMTAYSPLVNGRSGILNDHDLKTIGAKYKKSPAQVIIRWHIQRGVVVIPKSVFNNEIDENAKVFDFSLTDDEMALISGMDKNKRIVVPMCNGKMRDEKSIHFPFAIEF